MKNSTPRTQLPKQQLLDFSAKFQTERKISNKDVNLCEGRDIFKSNHEIYKSSKKKKKKKDNLQVMMALKQYFTVLLDIYDS